MWEHCLQSVSKKQMGFSIDFYFLSTPLSIINNKTKYNPSSLFLLKERIKIVPRQKKNVEMTQKNEEGRMLDVSYCSVVSRRMCAFIGCISSEKKIKDTIFSLKFLLN